jgi:hypothetical protein
VHREGEELPFGGPSKDSRYPGIEKSNDCLEHLIRRKGVTPMKAKGPPAQAEHYRLIGVGEDFFHVPEAQRLEPGGKTIFEKIELPRCPAAAIGITPLDATTPL